MGPQEASRLGLLSLPDKHICCPCLVTGDPVLLEAGPSPSSDSPLAHSSCWTCLWGPRRERPPSAPRCTQGWKACQPASKGEGRRGGQGSREPLRSNMPMACLAVAPQTPTACPPGGVGEGEGGSAASPSLPVLAQPLPCWRTALSSPTSPKPGQTKGRWGGPPRGPQASPGLLWPRSWSP